MFAIHGRGKYYFCFSLVPAYIYYQRVKKSEYETLRTVVDIDKIKKINVNNVFSYIPLFIITVYDEHIYTSKRLRKWYYKYKCFVKKNEKKKERYFNIHKRLKEGKNEEERVDALGRKKINYNFLLVHNHEKHLFNKLYIYEYILEKSIKYGILSPALSFYILKKTSEYCVNINTSLYNQKSFTKETKKKKKNYSFQFFEKWDNILREIYNREYEKNSKKKKKKKKKKKREKQNRRSKREEWKYL